MANTSPVEADGVFDVGAKHTGEDKRWEGWADWGRQQHTKVTDTHFSVHNPYGPLGDNCLMVFSHQRTLSCRCLVLV